MNLFTKQKQTHRLRKQTYGYQRGKGGRGINQEVKDLVLINKDLVYSTVNSTQYAVITYMGKEQIYVYV